MSRQIIILERTTVAGDQSFRAALWAVVPVARQTFYANAAIVSEVKNATAAENLALQNGSMVERVIEVRQPPGVTVAQAQAGLIQTLAAFQAEVNAATHPFRIGSTN